MKTQQLIYSENALETVQLLDLKCLEGGRIQIGTVQFLNGQRVPAEGTTTHVQREVSLILDGVLEVTSDGVTHAAKEGTLLEIPPGEEHYVKALEDSSVLYLLIDE